MYETLEKADHLKLVIPYKVTYLVLQTHWFHVGTTVLSLESLICLFNAHVFTDGD